MGILSTIIDKIFQHPAAKPQPQAAPAAAVPAQPASRPAQPAQPTAAQPAPAARPAPAPAPSQSAGQAQPVDVGAVLDQIAGEKGGGGNYRSSVVDLLKLLDMDSSLQAQKQLADELNVHAGDPGSAEENIALQRAVMEKLAQNGGKVPETLRH